MTVKQNQQSTDITACKKSTHFAKAVRYGVMAGGFLALSACQSLPSASTPKDGTPTLMTAQVPADTALTQAVKSALRSSFSYHSQISYSNALRERALANASTEQLAQSDDITTDCEHRHDTRYVALAKQAMADGVDISSDRYVDDRKKLQADFLACKSALDENADETDKPSDFGKYTALDVKKSQLLSDYVLSATTAQITGNYQPLKGVVTALPSAQYQSRNALILANQPTVLDFRAGKLYLWADNLALANATWLDKNLGLAWQDKWLAINLKDGSLPDEFLGDLAKQYATISATHNAKQVSYLSQERFEQLLQTAKDNEQSILKTANQIIVENHTGAGKLGAFYQAMIDKYPVLLEKPSEPENVVLDSKLIMQRTFAILKKRLDKQANDKQFAPISYYGLNNGKLVWHYHKSHLDNKNANEPMEISFLTHFDGKLNNPFVRLSAPHQMPTNNNQVDFLAYGNQLLADLKKENADTSAQLVARTLLAVLVGFDAPIGAEAEAESEAETQDETSRDNKTEATTGDGNQGEVNQDF